MTNPALLARRTVVAGLLVTALPAARHSGIVRIRMVTALGSVLIDLAADRAPVTVANFLRYVDARAYDDAAVYRTVTPAIDNNPRTIDVIQGGIRRDPPRFPPIPVETTAATGLSHRDGTISMARLVPGWSTPDATSEFFICVGDNPALDANGGRTADGLGFAAFGRVVRGMDVIRAIHRRRPGPGPGRQPAYWAGQLLDPPVAIERVVRA